MNPISKGSKTPPAISIQNNIYSLLAQTSEKDSNINCIGNLVEIHPESEIYEFLKQFGCEKIKHISHYDTFEDYQDMATSRMNLVITPVGRQAAGQMEEKHDTPSIFLPVSYRLEQIAANYEKLAAAFGAEGVGEFNFAPYIDEVKKAITRALSAVEDAPIIVDASAAKCPFGLARALVEYGFNVVRVQAPECIGIDKADFKWITEKHPEIEIVESLHHNAVLRENQIPESIAIGVDGAYLAGSKYVVDLFDDEGMYGYHGVRCLMEKLEHALDMEIDLEKMIHEYGLVV